MTTVDPFFSFEDDGDFDEFYGPSRRTTASTAPPSQEKQPAASHHRVESVGKTVPVTPVSNVSSFPSFSMPSTQGGEETERSAVSTLSPGRQSIDGVSRRGDGRRVPRRRRQRQAEEMFDVEWERDDDVASCFVCTNEFSLLRRKHHCRRCGRVICSDCSSFWRFGSSEKKKKHRVCTYCNVELAQHGKSQDPMARHTIVDVGVARHQSFSSDASFETPQAEKQLRFRKRGDDDFQIGERRKDAMGSNKSQIVLGRYTEETASVGRNQQPEKTELFDQSDDTWFIEPVASQSHETSKVKEETGGVDGSRYFEDANDWSSTRATTRQTYGGVSQVGGNSEELLHKNPQLPNGTSALRNPGDTQTFYGADADDLVVDDDHDYYRATLATHASKGTPGYAPTPVPPFPQTNAAPPDVAQSKQNDQNQPPEARNEPTPKTSPTVESGKNEKKGFKNVIKRFFGLKSAAPEPSEPPSSVPSAVQQPTKDSTMEPPVDSFVDAAPVSRPSTSSGIPTSDLDGRFTMVDDGRFVEPDASTFRHTIAAYQAPYTQSAVMSSTPAEFDTPASTAIEHNKPKRLSSKKRRDTFDDLFESTTSNNGREGPPQAAKLWSHVNRSSVTTGMTGVSRFDQRQEENDDDDDLTRALGLPASSNRNEASHVAVNTVDREHFVIPPSSRNSQIAGMNHYSRRSNDFTNSVRDRNTLLGEFVIEKTVVETHAVGSGVDDYFADFEKPKDYIFDTVSGSYIPANSQPRSRVDRSPVPSSVASYPRTEIDTYASSKLSVSMLAGTDEPMRSTQSSSTPNQPQEVSGAIVDKISSLENEIRALKELLQNKLVSAPSSEGWEDKREDKMNRSRKTPGKSAGPRKPSIFDNDSSEDEKLRSKPLAHDADMAHENQPDDKFKVRSKPRSKGRSRSKRKDSFAALFEEPENSGGSQLASTAYESLFQTGGGGDVAHSSGSDEDDSISTRRQVRRLKPSPPQYDDSTPVNGRATDSRDFEHQSDESVVKRADSTPALNSWSNTVALKKKKKDAIDALFDSDEENDVVMLHQTSTREIASARVADQTPPDPIDDSDEEFSSMLKLRKKNSNRSFTTSSISKASRSIFEDDVISSHSSSDNDRETVKPDSEGSRLDEMNVDLSDGVMRRTSGFLAVGDTLPESELSRNDDPDSDEEFAAQLQQKHTKRLLSSSSLRGIKPHPEEQAFTVDDDRSEKPGKMSADSNEDEHDSAMIISATHLRIDDAIPPTIGFDDENQSGQLDEAPGAQTEFDPLSFLEDADTFKRLQGPPTFTFVDENVLSRSKNGTAISHEDVELVSPDTMTENASVTLDNEGSSEYDEEAPTGATTFAAIGVSAQALCEERVQSQSDGEPDIQSEAILQGGLDTDVPQAQHHHDSEDDDVVHLTRISRTTKYTGFTDPHPLENVSTDDSVSLEVEVSKSAEYQSDWQQMQAQEKERRRKLKIKQRQAQREKVKRQSTSSRSLTKGVDDGASESSSSMGKHRSDKKPSKDGRHEKDKRKKKRPSRSHADEDDQGHTDVPSEGGALTEL